ncbi:hypothetical protein WME91_26370 [Sorangium sp. So ce269]
MSTRAGSAGVPAGSAGVPAGSPFVVPPPPGAPSAPSRGVVTAPRARGASGAGALYGPPAAPPRDPLRELWPPTPAGSLDELFDAASPDAPRFSRGRDRAGVPRGHDDDGDQGDLVDPWSLQEAAVGAVEGIYQLVVGTAEDLITGMLYMTPVGIPLAVRNIRQAAGEIERETAEHGGGVPGLLEALNERYNPLVGLAENAIELVEAVEDEDARAVGNRSVKLGIEVLGMAAMLRGGGKTRFRPFGQSQKNILRRAPKSWRREPVDSGSGWKLVDENGFERVRFMRPDPRSRGVWHRLKLGYWRMQDELGRLLDENGNVVPESDPDYKFKTHIPYTGK